MIIKRKENAAKNIKSGLILRLYQIAMPFLLRTVMIYTLGMEYLGLSSLFTSVLQVLNLAELGVGSAMVYSMYEPIAHDKHDKICMLMNLYKVYYRCIGIIVMILGLCLIPFLDKLISGSIPNGINLYFLYLLNLCATVVSYWLFAYKNSLLTAHQRTDVINKVRLCTFTFQYFCQILSLAVLHNYYLYVITTLATQIVTNISTAIVTEKLYPSFKAKGKLDTEERNIINHHIKDLFTAKLGGVITNSADAVVISSFLGLVPLALYNNYYYIMSSIIGMIAIIFNACLAGIGNSLVVESVEKNYKDFKKFTLLLSWTISFCTVSLYCLYQPFMKMWVHEERMLEHSYVILICIYFFIYETTQVWATYKDAGGIWHQDRFRPLCVSVFNLILNLILVQVIGLYGVLLSTVISYIVVGMPWMLKNIFTCLFKTSCLPYLKLVGYYIVVVVIGCALCDFVCNFLTMEGIIGILLKGVIVLIFSNLYFAVMYHWLPEFNEVIEMMKNIGLKLFRRRKE